ncbi:hypothetical protein FRB95_008576 [Tulasnella sp. JGI-2019a]|nr:hypothetical protein FRB95_008576 [Tulasnella sp. JGI-2019a]
MEDSPPLTGTHNLDGAPHDTATLPFASSLSSTPVAPPSSELKLTPTAMTSLAARKAALFEKFGGGSPPMTTTTSNSPSAISSVWSPGVGSTNNWKASVSTGLVRERRESLVPVEQLLPAHTGSTVASTAVESATVQSSDTSSSPPKLVTSVSRVKLAIMAINAKDQPAKGDNPSPSNGGRMSRSWSRMSGFTQINEGDGLESIASVKWLTLEEEGSGTPSLSHSRDTSMASTMMAMDESFDTHPPDMVSPRTTLAHVVHPPAPPARKLSQHWSFTTPVDPPVIAPLSEPVPSPPQIIHEDVDEVVNLITRPATPVEEPQLPPAPVTEQDTDTPQPISTSPTPAPVPESIPAPAPAPTLCGKTTPIILRGEGRKVTLPLSRADPVKRTAKSHIRRPSSSMTQIPIRPSSSRALIKSISVSASVSSPTSPAPRTLSRNRISSSITVSIPVHDGPVIIKAQNQHPLRKVKTSAPPPMRFSMAL